MSVEICVEVYRGRIAPFKWFWRIRWSNSKVVATSDGVPVKSVAVTQAQLVADKMGVPMRVLEPTLI